LFINFIPKLEIVRGPVTLLKSETQTLSISTAKYIDFSLPKPQAPTVTANFMRLVKSSLLLILSISLKYHFYDKYNFLSLSRKWTENRIELALSRYL